ncbi:MAG: nicotinamide mononucleotide transporter [Oscillospiraceae bacterium]|nr:nicotinamide mononucleotide transporter [Oscillospiraceae bacterium]
METKKKESFKSFLKSFTPYQIIYLAAVVLLTAVCVIFFPDTMLGEEVFAKTFLVISMVTSIISNPLCELLISKQSKWNFVVDFFLIEIPELVICLNFGWYAVAATVVFFWMPIDVISFIRWTKHPSEDDANVTHVKRLKGWQTALAVVAIIAFGLLVGKLLQFVPGASDTYLDAFASAVGMSNGILLLLRYSEQWLAWLITTILYLFMDISSGAYVLLITEIAMLVNTIYGIVKWFIYTKKHPTERIKEKA